MKVSLIMPTIGRVSELYSFLSSVSYDGETTLWVADQNDRGFIPVDELVAKRKDLTVNYIWSDKKGLSYNRNLLINKTRDVPGIIAFPDDDCTYYPDTLKKVEFFFEQNPHVDVVIGCIYDRENKKFYFKPWPKKKKKINKLNVYFMASSITIFVRQPLDVSFDELMGAGSIYGSCEDPDFLYKLLKLGKTIAYDPSIQVWHPEPDFSSISLEKTYSYSKGFGYFIRKDMDIYKTFLLFSLIIKKTIQFFLRNSKFPKGYFFSYFSGLYDGFSRK